MVSVATLTGQEVRVSIANFVSVLSFYQKDQPELFLHHGKYLATCRRLPVFAWELLL